MSWLLGARARLRLLLRRRAADERMDEEFRFHVEMETERRVRAGADPAEARRQALIAFGGVERHRETMRQERGLRPLEDLARDLRGTVLAHSIKEGAADFVAELFAGCAVQTPEYMAEGEDEVWAAFRGDMLGRDFNMWLYNGWNRERLGDRPPDLGYYMGYRIARAYYERAPDKDDALRTLFNIRDFRRFFEASGCAEVC